VGFVDKKRHVTHFFFFFFFAKKKKEEEFWGENSLQKKERVSSS